MESKALRIQAEEVKSLYEMAYDRIKEAIVNGSLVPGERISERKLAEEMGISTSPIKQALNRLSFEGLTEIKPRKGTYVSACRQPDFTEIIMIEANLEGMAARFCALHIKEEEIRDLRKILLQMNKLTMQGDLQGLAVLNQDFHRKIQFFSRSRYLCRLLGMVQPFWDRVRNPLTSGEEARICSTEHQGIFEALAYHQGEVAEERMKTHILRNLKESCQV
jgi:DNA-binding GntR family transcriptional regulator